MVDKNLATARTAVARISSALDSEPRFSENLAQEYNRAKNALAASFQAMALEVVPRDAFPLAEVKSAVAARMRVLFEGQVDSSLFVIRRYTTPHPDLYALLAESVGTPVPGWRLRILSGDKIHTERRTRELRDLGLSIEVDGGQDDTSYCLSSLTPDLTYGAAFQLRETAIKSRRLSHEDALYAVSLAERTVPLPPRRTNNAD